MWANGQKESPINNKELKVNITIRKELKVNITIRKIISELP